MPVKLANIARYPDPDSSYHRIACVALYSNPTNYTDYDPLNTDAINMPTLAFTTLPVEVRTLILEQAFDRPLEFQTDYFSSDYVKHVRSKKAITTFFHINRQIRTEMAHVGNTWRLEIYDTAKGALERERAKLLGVRPLSRMIHEATELKLAIAEHCRRQNRCKVIGRQIEMLKIEELLLRKVLGSVSGELQKVQG